MTALARIATLFESCTCHVVPLAQLIVNPAALCGVDVDSSERFRCEELRVVVPNTSLHVYATLPAAASLRQFLPAVGSALLPAVGPLFS